MKKLSLCIMLLCPLAHAEYCYRTDMTLAQLSQCAKKGDFVAQYNLGMKYFEGSGVSQDYKVAFRLFSDSAAKNHAPAQYSLMMMYGVPKGFQQDYKKTLDSLFKSAEQNYAPAQNLLGQMYYNGIDSLGKGVAKDYILSYMWFELSAAQNNAEAIKNRNNLAKKMHPDQIKKAKEMSIDWIAKHPQK